MNAPTSTAVLGLRVPLALLVKALGAGYELDSISGGQEGKFVGILIFSLCYRSAVTSRSATAYIISTAVRNALANVHFKGCFHPIGFALVLSRKG